MVKLSHEGDVIILTESGETFVGIQCGRDEYAYEVHNKLSGLDGTVSFGSEVQEPVKFKLGNGRLTPLLIAAPCGTPTPLSKLDPTWFFKFVPDYIDNSGDYVPQYGTVSMKKFVYTLLRNALVYGKDRIHPVLSLDKLFIDNDNEIIFAEYKYRVWNCEADMKREVNNLLRDIFKKHGQNSPTLHKEIELLCSWVDEFMG